MIFTQYIGMGQMIQTLLENRYGIQVPFLRGSTPKESEIKWWKLSKTAISRFHPLSQSGRYGPQFNGGQSRHSLRSLVESGG